MDSYKRRMTRRQSTTRAEREGRALAKLAALLECRQLEKAFDALCAPIAAAVAGSDVPPRPAAIWPAPTDVVQTSTTLARNGNKDVDATGDNPVALPTAACTRVKRCHQRRVQRGRCRYCEMPVAKGSTSRCWGRTATGAERISKNNGDATSRLGGEPNGRNRSRRGNGGEPAASRGAHDFEAFARDGPTPANSSDSGMPSPFARRVIVLRVRLYCPRSIPLMWVQCRLHRSASCSCDSL